MHRITSQDELVARIKQIKQRSRWKMPFSLKAVLTMSNPNGRVRHGWTYMHEPVDYQGTRINVKVPALTTPVLLTWRKNVEAAYNQSFAIGVSPVGGLEAEALTYKKLNQLGFPTLTSLQHLVEDHGFPLVKGVLLTEQIPYPENLQDLVTADKYGRMGHYASIAAKMKQLHGHGEIWVDSLPQNTMRNQGEILLFDFNLIPNPMLSEDQLQSLDLTNLCLSAAGRLERNYGDVMKPIIGVYDPSDKVREAMEKRLKIDVETPRGRIATVIEEFFYLRPKYLLTREKATEAKRAILKAL